MSKREEILAALLQRDVRVVLLWDDKNLRKFAVQDFIDVLSVNAEVATADLPAGVNVSTYILGEATVVQDITIGENFSRKVTDVAAQHLEERVRSALVRLGWT